jgi:nucleotide-binding universal stress UspA family protein
MFDKILFATTASPTCDAAANVAFDLAKKYHSKLTVFHVLGFPSRGFSPFVVDVRTGQEEACDPDYVEWVREEMKNTYAKQLGQVETCSIETCAGVAHTEILRLARKEDVDLIVMGAHTRQEEVGAARFRSVVGSTMQKVAKSARCPVLIVSRPCKTCFWYFSNMIFGTDFSKAADSAFMFAYQVAREIGCRLYLFHALDLGEAQGGKVVSQEEIEEKIQAARKKIEEKYVSLMNGFDNYEIEIWEGIPHVEILKFAREKSGDLIVMAHHTREMDPEKALLGSTVEQVVLRAACPVASVNHPDKVELP